MSSITVRHDLRGRFGPARDQEERQTCLAFAMSDAHAAAIGGTWSPLSCEYLFYYSKQRDGTPADEGTTLPAIRAALELDGQPIESDWPYLPKLPADLSQWEPPANVGIIYRCRSKRNRSAFDEVWEAIEADQPVLIAKSFSTAFLQPRADGLVDADEPDIPVVRHAVLGVATADRGKQRLVLVRNSWGETWGLKGYAWLSERYLATRLIAALTVN